MYDYLLKVNWTRIKDGRVTTGGVLTSAYNVKAAIHSAERMWWPDYELDVTEAKRIRETKVTR